MPEVVEVEIQAQGLRMLKEDTIEEVTFEERGETLIRPMSGLTFKTLLEGRTIKDVVRLGKYIGIQLDTYDYLVSHLAMTGSWLLDFEAGHARIVFRMKSGRILRFNDTRFFARLYIENYTDFCKREKGVDVLTADRTTIERVLTNNIYRNMNLKKLLLKQEILSGLGNVYVNESLYFAGLYPGKFLTPEIIPDLAFAIKFTIEKGYHLGGLSMKDYFHVDGTRGMAQDNLQVYKKPRCGKCGSVIKRTEEFDKRATYYCPRCQHK